MRNQHVIIFLLILIIPFISATASAQPETECNPIQETEICIQEVSLSKTTVDVGNSTEITLKVQNAGNQTGDAAVLIGIRQPEGEYDHYRVEEIHNLEPGNTQTVTVGLPIGGSVGVHELNVMVFDQPEQHLYDSSGYYQKITVEDDDRSFDPISWFNSLGTLAQSALAIITLVIFLLTGRFTQG